MRFEFIMYLLENSPDNKGMTRVCDIRHACDVIRRCFQKQSLKRIG